MIITFIQIELLFIALDCIGWGMVLCMTAV